jgi:hypothetical protein
MITQEQIISQEVRALSWKEPYGSLMLPPFNKIETRIWGTYYRGPVLICASKKSYNGNQIIDISGLKVYEKIFNEVLTAEMLERPGTAFAITNLINCRPMLPEDEEKAFVQYYPDLFSWIFEDVTEIEPFPWKGSLGLRRLTPEEKKLIKLKK